MRRLSQAGSLVNNWFLELVAKFFSRYDSAALIPAISTGLIVTQEKTAPVFRISIIPDIRAARKAIMRPFARSRVSIVKSFDFINEDYLAKSFDEAVCSEWQLNGLVD